MRRALPIRLAPAVAAALAMLCAPSVRAGDAVAPEVRLIAAGIRSFRTSTQSLQVHLRLEEYIPREERAFFSDDPRGAERETADEERVARSRFYREGANLALVVTPEPGSRGLGDLRLERFVRTPRGIRSLTLYLRKRRDRPGETFEDLRGGIATAARLPETGLEQAREQQAPLSYAYYDQMRPLDQILLDPSKRVTLQGEEPCEGSRCLKVRVENPQAEGAYTLYWIDREHDLLLRRLESYRPVAGKVLLWRRTQVPSLLSSNGWWFPESSVETSQLHLPQADLMGEAKKAWAAPILTMRVKVEDGVVTLPPITRRATLSHFVVGVPIPPEVFQLDWPVGTALNDDTGREFLISANPVDRGDTTNADVWLRDVKRVMPGAVAPGGWMADPRSLSFAIPPGATQTATIRFTLPDAGEITAAKPDSDAIAVTFKRNASKSGIRAWEATVNLKAPLRLGPWESKLVFTRTPKGATPITIPVRVDVTPDLRANPNPVFFGFAKAGSLVAREVAVTSVTGQPFQVLEVKPSQPWVKVGAPVPAPGGYCIRLSIEAGGPGLAEAFLDIRTSVTGEEQIRVPVSGWVEGQ